MSAETTARVNFLDGDRISGSVLKLDQETLFFQSRHLKNSAAQLKTTAILSVELDHKSDKESEESTKPQTDLEPKAIDHIAIITLKSRYGHDGENGTLKGQLRQITDDLVTLHTDYAGEIKIKRSLIHSIHVDSPQTLLYSGPNSLEEWRHPGNKTASWNFSDNTLTCSNPRSVIARDFDLPDRCHLRYHIKWKENLSHILHLFADFQENGSATNYYQISIQENYIYMTKRVEGERSPQLVRMPNAGYNHDKSSADIDLFMDKEHGVFHLLINGKHVHTFTDQTPTPDKLAGSIYFKNDRGQTIQISDIKLRKWNGTLQNNSEKDVFRDLEKSNQRLLLANGDGIAGDIDKIENNHLKITTKHTPLLVPIARIRRIDIPSKINGPKADARDVKAYFNNGGWITITVDTIDDTKIHGSNEAIGSHAFNLDAFKKIDFNIYNREANKERNKSAW